MDAAKWEEYSQAFAFLGNSLLKPMTQTAPVGLEPQFWQEFPTYDSKGLEQELVSMANRVEALGQKGTEAAVETVAVEYTKLFVGPPSPLAAPWETFYRAEGVTIGYGVATADMRNRLFSVGLEVSPENNQYADHVGIEVLLLSQLCLLASKHDQRVSRESIIGYMDERPLSWIEKLAAKIDQVAPQGYMLGLVQVTKELMLALRNEILVEGTSAHSNSSSAEVSSSL